jgi:aminoglycoside phosphotransferase (APT) family kinase protein
VTGTEPIEPPELPELPGLPSAPVDAWLRASLPDLVGDQPWQAQPILGGRSNLTYRLQTAGAAGDQPARLILRRPPLGGIVQSAHDMGREVRVLRALAPTPVPVPPVLAYCTDTDVLGVPFYVMAEVAGAVIRTSADAAALTEAQRAALGDELSTVFANLHLVDPLAVGLDDFGRHTGYSGRQISRWARQWEATRTRDLPDMDELVRRLTERIPPDSGLSIVHGDFRLDNTIATFGAGDSAEIAAIAAVVDWELSTLGDPLADLGLTLTYWHDLGDDERGAINIAHGVTAHPGFPTGDEFAQAYSVKTGHDLADLPFYRALGAMKLAAILEGVHARYLAGHNPGDDYEDVSGAVPVLVARGLRQLGG